MLIRIAPQTSARSTGLVRLTEHRDAFGGPVYSWMISQDEQERLSVLLKADFYDTGIEGTYVTAPPQVCPHCGKKTEFIDWQVPQSGTVHCIDQDRFSLTGFTPPSNVVYTRLNSSSSRSRLVVPRRACITTSTAPAAAILRTSATHRATKAGRSISPTRRYYWSWLRPPTIS